MRTALDSNVLSALLTGEPDALSIARTLKTCEQDGPLLICGAVYCELSAHPRMAGDALHQFLAEEEFEVDWQTGREVWRRSALAFTLYVRRKRESGSSLPRTLLADFIIGAHAELAADRLFTFDERLFKTYFPDLHLVEPSIH